MPHRNENMKKFTSKVHGPPPSGMATKAAAMVKKDPPLMPGGKNASDLGSHGGKKYTTQRNPFTKRPEPKYPEVLGREEVDPNKLEDWFEPNNPKNPALNQPKNPRYGSSQ